MALGRVGSQFRNWSDGSNIYHTSKTVSLTWGGGSTTPYVPYVITDLDLSEFSHIYSVTPRYKTGAYSDRCLPCVLGMSTNKKYKVGAYNLSTYVNSYTNVSITFDVIAEN